VNASSSRERFRAAIKERGPGRVLKSEKLAWERDGHDWPNRAASIFPVAAGLRWHVQRMGKGPILLLVHGTGASTHSWRDVMPLLARTFTVIAPDLPGHGFTETPSPDRLSLPGMAAALTGVLKALGASPVYGVGHSAGAAILVRMCLDRGISPAGLTSLNGALLPLNGMAGYLFSPVAKIIAGTALVPQLFARYATDRRVVEKLIRGTGSTLSPVGVDLYGRLVSNPAHVAAALAMMANWDLRSLAGDLPRLGPRLLLVAAGDDATIPPDQAFAVRDLLPGTTVEYIRGLGHLAHEEKPALIAELIERQVNPSNETFSDKTAPV
jgi:putative magnesium chelatase accessory protein